MQIEDVKKLAELARIDMSEEEMKGVAKDFDSILAYVDQIKEVSDKEEEKSKNKEDFVLRNVLREDEVTNIGGENTFDLLANAPNKEDGFVKVKQIM